MGEDVRPDLVPGEEGFVEPNSAVVVVEPRGHGESAGRLAQGRAPTGAPSKHVGGRSARYGAGGSLDPPDVVDVTKVVGPQEAGAGDAYLRDLGLDLGLPVVDEGTRP